MDQPAITFAISDLAREFSITPRTIRFWEDQGILAPQREAGGVLASGVRVRDLKALAFAVSAFFAGIGGSLLAHQYTYIDTTMFTLLMSLLAATIVIMGGVGLPYGAVVGSVILIGAMELLRQLGATPSRAV